jgi:predicted 3-demethylubiquinone-9 3-methyltransferase (glyoxalase superfamily)
VVDCESQEEIDHYWEKLVRLSLNARPVMIDRLLANRQGEPEKFIARLCWHNGC